jgi:glycosyltransferase involved in cell wall biosynthesis
MKIGVVHPTSGWILSHIAHRICETVPDVFEPIGIVPVEPGETPEEGEAPEGTGQISVAGDLSAYRGWFYVDMQSCWATPLKGPLPGVHIGFFTHLEEDEVESIHPDYGVLDGIVHMNKHTQNWFGMAGILPDERMTVLHPGEVRCFPQRKVALGVCQRGGHKGKGSEFLPRVLAELSGETRAGIRLAFLGEGWLEHTDPPEDLYGVPLWHADYHGVEALEIEGEGFYPDAYHLFYESIDYLLIPSLWEGGPMALLEALATGTPVIAAAVGWVDEFLSKGVQGPVLTGGEVCFTYPAGDVERLVGILDYLVGGRADLRARVVGMSWEKYTADLLDFFDHIESQ